MNKFDDSVACPKCGGSDLSASYCERTWCTDYDHKYGRCQDAAGPHIHRYCGRCRYDWLEAPLDAEEAGE